MDVIIPTCLTEDVPVSANEMQPEERSIGPGPDRRAQAGARGPGTPLVLDNRNPFIGRLGWVRAIWESMLQGIEQNIDRGGLAHSAAAQARRSYERQAGAVPRARPVGCRVAPDAGSNCGGIRDVMQHMLQRRLASRIRAGADMGRIRNDRLVSRRPMSSPGRYYNEV